MNFISPQKHFDCKHDFKGWHTIIRHDSPVISKMDSVPQKEGSSVHQFSVVMLLVCKPATEKEKIPATDGI